VAALRFFFVSTLHQHEFREYLPYPKAARKLPNILSREEVARLINASSSLFERTLLMVLYGTGMRRAEIARLKIADIDSQRMIVRSIDAGNPRILAFADAGLLRAAAVAQHVAGVVPGRPYTIRSGEVLARYKHLGPMLLPADNALGL
jgi:site-specific recombinase XerD